MAVRVSGTLVGRRRQGRTSAKSAEGEGRLDTDHEDGDLFRSSALRDGVVEGARVVSVEERLLQPGIRRDDPDHEGKESLLGGNRAEVDLASRLDVGLGSSS
jgi:hypothetical protein